MWQNSFYTQIEGSYRYMIGSSNDHLKASTVELSCFLGALLQPEVNLVFIWKGIILSYHFQEWENGKCYVLSVLPHRIHKSMLPEILFISESPTPKIRPVLCRSLINRCQVNEWMDK